MKFVKGISLFFIYPVVMLGIGFFAGIKAEQFFYPYSGEQNPPLITTEDEVPKSESRVQEQEPGKPSAQKEEAGEVQAVSNSMEKLTVDTEYVLEEADMLQETVVETVWRLPDKYVGMTREQFLEAMELYEAFPPLAEMERGFVDLEVLSFSRERVVVKMNYLYVQPSQSFYLAVRNNEVVVYLEDRETIYINTGISMDSLPNDMQMEIMQMLWIEDEESLYDFLETYSS